MNITMTDTSIRSLVKRTEEKIAEGYEVVKKIERDGNAGTVKEYLPKWRIIMRKVNK